MTHPSAPSPVSFSDHFGRSASDYARFRPGYPAALFAWVAGLAPRRDTVWDCGTGSGQAAGGLAAHFRRVVATDASRDQLWSAERYRNVYFAASLAEAAPLRRGSVDLVVVAQALHWFGLPAFLAEVAYAMSRDGVLAVWAYGRLSIAPAVDRVVNRFYQETVGPYWLPERRHVERGYADLVLPIAETAAPGFAIEATLTLPELTGYLGTWSATARYRKDRGEDPVPAVAAELAPLWGDPAVRRPACWPLSVRAGRWLGLGRG